MPRQRRRHERWVSAFRDLRPAFGPTADESFFVIDGHSGVMRESLWIKERGLPEILDLGSPLILLIDTGLAGGAFTCPPSTLRAAGIDLGKAPRFTGLGGGRSVEVQPFEVAALTLGTARQEGLTGIAGAFPAQLEWDFGFRIGGLISHQFFLPYAVTFDFARMVIRLEEET